MRCLTAGFEHLRDDHVEIFGLCAVIHDAGTQAELGSQGCIRQVYAAFFIYLFQNERIQAIEITFRAATRAEVSEAHGAQLDRCHKFQFRLVHDLFCEVASVTQIILY